MGWIEDAIKEKVKKREKNHLIKAKIAEYFDKMIKFNERLPIEIRYKHYLNRIGPFHLACHYIIINDSPSVKYDLDTEPFLSFVLYIHYDHDYNIYYLKYSADKYVWYVDDDSISILFRNAISDNLIWDGLRKRNNP